MNQLRTRLFAVATMALLVVPQTLAFQKKPETTNEKKSIYAAGCVQAGVEAGCLVLSKNNTVYSLFFKGKKPALGSAIRFTGTPHEGPTSCMQGEAIDVKTWTAIKMKCVASGPQSGQ